MSEIAKMAIKWPKLKNDYFLLKKQFYYLSIILYQLSFINIYNSRPRNIENSITSDESMKIMILSKMAQKWSKWPTKAFINHRLGQIGDIESLKRFWKRQVFSQWFGVESPYCLNKDPEFYQCSESTIYNDTNISGYNTALFKTAKDLLTVFTLEAIQNLPSCTLPASLPCLPCTYQNMINRCNLTLICCKDPMRSHK